MHNPKLMKHIYLWLIGLTIITSCTKDSDPEITPVTCSPTSVTLFDKAFTRLVFGPDDEGGQQLNKVTVYEGTDSSYVYTFTYSTRLESISLLEEGETVVFTAAYDNENLVKLSTGDSPGDISAEFVFVYSGSRVSSAETWVKATDNNLYKIAHTALIYSGDGNLSRSETNIDLVALLTIAFGGVPDAPYAPFVAASTEYDYGSEDAPNPIFGSYFMENPDMIYMQNLPISITYKDENGNVTNSEAYTITLDDNGYPIEAISGIKYLEATYDCN